MCVFSFNTLTLLLPPYPPWYFFSPCSWKYWIGQKVNFGFPLTSYGKTQVNFLVNQITCFSSFLCFSLFSGWFYNFFSLHWCYVTCLQFAFMYFSSCVLVHWVSLICRFIVFIKVEKFQWLFLQIFLCVSHPSLFFRNTNCIYIIGHLRLIHSSLVPCSFLSIVSMYQF